MVEVTDECTYEKEKLKYILDVDEGSLEVESRLIELAAWLREQYASTMLQALRTVLPVKQRIKEKQKKTLLLKCEREKEKSSFPSMRRENAIKPAQGFFGSSLGRERFRGSWLPESLASPRVSSRRWKLRDP